MNAYERVMSTLQGKPVDRPPVLAVLGAYGGQLANIPLKQLYTDVDSYIQGQQAVQEAFHLDMVLAPFDFSVLAEAFGGITAFFENQAPNMKTAPAETIQDAIALKIPDLETDGRLPCTPGMGIN